MGEYWHIANFYINGKCPNLCVFFYAKFCDFSLVDLEYFQFTKSVKLYNVRAVLLFSFHEVFSKFRYLIWYFSWIFRVFVTNFYLIMYYSTQFFNYILNFLFEKKISISFPLIKLLHKFTTFMDDSSFILSRNRKSK